MNQEEFGKFIKQIRKNNNLTQKQLADKYNVTYQAVSKWERGINMPDTMLIKQIAEDFNISIDDIFKSKYNKKNKNRKIIILSIISLFIILALIILCIILCTKKNKNFSFKTISSDCNNFNISGNISYDKNKTAIYLSNIEYCGESNNESYKKIECTLYETTQDTKKIISTYNYNGNKNIKLEEFLKNLTLISDNYSRICKEYKEDTLYLEINATTEENKITTYKIPLKLNDDCSK